MPVSVGVLVVFCGVCDVAFCNVVFFGVFDLYVCVACDLYDCVCVWWCGVWSL